MVTKDVFETCLMHSLITEREEIMGILMGDVVEQKDEQVALIWGLSIQQRSDRRKDRVEISPTQLAAAVDEAEKMSTKHRTTRVIGWYHSHPRITVPPSHVDVRTQAEFQQLDRGFIGLIFSVFNMSRSNDGRMQVIAFQSRDGDPHSGHRYEAKEIPLVVISASEMLSPAEAETSVGQAFSHLVKLQRTLFNEEKQRFLESIQPPTSVKLSHAEEEKSSSSSKSEAHGDSASSNSSPDTEVYCHPLVRQHNSAVYEKTLCKLLEYISFPLVEAFHKRHEENLQKIEQAKIDRVALETRLAELKANAEVASASS